MQVESWLGDQADKDGRTEDRPFSRLSGDDCGRVKGISGERRTSDEGVGQYENKESVARKTIGGPMERQEPMEVQQENLEGRTILLVLILCFFLNVLRQ